MQWTEALETLAGLEEHSSNSAAGEGHNVWRQDRTWNWRTMQLKSLYFLPVAEFHPEGCGKPLGVSQQDGIPTTAGRRDEKDTWWRQGHRLGDYCSNSGEEWGGSRFILLSQSPSTRPCTLAFRAFYSPRHQHLKLLFLPLQGVAVLIMITLLYGALTIWQTSS